MNSALKLDRLSVRIDGAPVCKNISFALAPGDIGCLLGPSGCGKTTLLRCIAGFLRAAAGELRIGEARVAGDGLHVAPERRRTGMVFQEHALFPHLNARDNITFGLRKWPAERRRRRLAKMLELIDLARSAALFPHELSGGECRRVALARALAPEPDLLLLDEPFSGLDAELRPQLAEQVRDILNEEGITALMVTHDQTEALSIADTLGVMDDGRLLQWGDVYSVYHCPASRQIATFVGMGSMLDGLIGGAHVETALGRFPVEEPRKFSDGERVQLLVRPDDIIHDDASPMQAVIEKKQFRGAEFLYRLRLRGGEKVYCFAPSHHDHQVGDPIGIVADLEHVVIFSSQAGA